MNKKGKPAKVLIAMFSRDKKSLQKFSARSKVARKYNQGMKDLEKRCIAREIREIQKTTNEDLIPID